MGRHETFDNATPIAEQMLAGTMLGRVVGFDLPNPSSEASKAAQGISPALAGMVAEWEALYARLNSGLEDDEAASLHTRWVELQTAIYGYPATGIAGLVAKAPAVREESAHERKGSLPHAAWTGLLSDLGRLSAIAGPSLSNTSSQPQSTAHADGTIVDRVDFASATMDELRALRDTADLVGGVADAAARQGRCKVPKSGGRLNAAGELMHWLGDALSDLAVAAKAEAQPRTPTNPSDRETRLALLASRIVDGGDQEQTAAFARELADHAAAGMKGA